MPEKPQVEIIAHINMDGEIIPLKIRMHAGNNDMVYSVSRAEKPVKGASLKIGVQGDKYACVIDGKKALLYRDFQNRWFVERI